MKNKSNKQFKIDNDFKTHYKSKPFPKNTKKQKYSQPQLIVPKDIYSNTEHLLKLFEIN